MIYFSTNGKCYKCNPNRGSEGGYGWVWEEDISYGIWKDKTQLFYDALGRKTQIHPKVRRYLFAPKGDRNSKFGTLDHELRHQSDARKITGTKNIILIDKTICKSNYCSWEIEMRDSLDNERINFYKAKIDSASDYYHNQCYNYGKCD